MNRFLMTASASLTLYLAPIGTLALAGEDTVAHAPDQYRYGAPFRSVRAGTADECAQTCDADAGCDAWSFVNPLGEAPARCELKHAFGHGTYMPGAVSGISKKYAVEQIDLRDLDELSGGPSSMPARPVRKPLQSESFGPALPAGSPSAPVVYRGNSELDGSASIVKPDN